MKKHSLPSTIIALIALFIPTYLVYVLIVGLVTRDVYQVGRSSLYYMAALLSFWVLFAILQRLGVRVLDQATDAIIEAFQSMLMGYEKEYRDYIEAYYRDFEVKGLTIPDVRHNLPLRQVYVELLLSPIDATTRTASNIWHFISSKKDGSRGLKLVILGLPGSGKTTLLRHITLQLVDTDRHSLLNDVRNPIPILLTLRDHAKAIEGGADFLLTRAITNALAGKAAEPPNGWFDKALAKGQCVIMMDGLDEIADLTMRTAVTEWVKKQMSAYPNNHFIIASRPYGYLSNPLTGVEVLEVQPFALEQIQRFVHNWYLTNEIAKSNKDDRGVRLKAKENAEDLIERLKERQELTKLAETPLLVAMIATVHSFKVPLPGRRVALYRDIISASTKVRRGIVGLKSRLAEDQKIAVLRVLAWYMMIQNMRDIGAIEISKAIQDQLLSVAGRSVSADGFLQDIEDQSGLLLNIGDARYSFAHLTFQEYLASSYAVTAPRSLEPVLMDKINDSWWAETIRLYAAQIDATKVVEACIRNDNINLAYDCLREAHAVSLEIRDSFHEYLSQCMNSEEPDRRAVAARAKLDSRLRWMNSLNTNLSIDGTLVSNIEYQFFLDEMRKKGEYYCPDHWGHATFSKGTGTAPVVGVRPKDAMRFCEWLNKREIWQASYRIPTVAEANSLDLQNDDAVMAYWIKDDSLIRLKVNGSTATDIAQKRVIQRIESDITQLRDLHDALQIVSTPPKKTEELLRNLPPIGGGNLIRRPLGHSSGGAPVEQTLARNDRIKHLLKKFEQYAGKYNLDLNNIIEYASTLLLKDRESEAAGAMWLSAAKEMYYLGDFDIEDKIAAFERSLTDDEVRHYVCTF